MAEIASFGVDVDENTKLAQNAQDTANKAGTGIGNLNDPNKLSPAEKATLKRKYDTDVLLYGMDTQKLTDNQLSTSEIDSTMNALTTYMTPFFANMSSTDTVDRDTLNTVYSNFDTADKDSDSAFTNMVSNTASDALSAGNQAKKAGSEAAVAGNQASEAANNAAAQASVAVSKANVAQSSVATAIAKAGFANDTASTASQAANDAKTIASQAANNVAIAKNDAANALTSAASAQNVASSAVATANSTASDFGKVSQKADSAVASAMSAESDASSAVIQASSAAADSKDAKQIAGAVSQSYKTLTDGSTMTIAELQNGLAAKLTKTDLNGYSTKDWTQNKIKVTADGINGTMSSIKKTVDGQTTDINNLQADSHGFKEQFTTVNDTIGKHTTDIGTLQTSSKELVSNFDSLSTANGKNEHNISELKQNAKGFSSTLETVQTQVQNSAVGTNLLLNTGDFSGNWSLNGILDTSQKPAVSHYPMKSLTSGTNVIANQQLNNGLLQPSTTYTASFYAKGTGTFIFYCYPSVANGERSDAHTNIKLTSDYKLYTITFTTIPDISGDKNFLLRQDYSPSETDQNTVEAYVYGFKLEKGSLATDWSANPADNATVTAVSKISQTADGAQVLATNNKGDITNLQATAKGIQTTVSNNYSDLKSQNTQTAGLVQTLVGKSPSNIIKDGGFNSAVVGQIPSGWNFPSTAQIAANPNETNGLVALDHPVLQINSKTSGNSDIYYGDWFDVQPGDQFYAELKARWSSMSQKGQIRLGVNTKDATGKWTWNSAVSIGSPSNWTKYTGVLTIPAGAVQGRVWVAWQGSAAADEAVFVTDLVVRPAYSTQSDITQSINNIHLGFKNPDGSKFQMNLSADGTALMDFSKIMLNGQTNIQAATIGNAQIANGAITNAKIGNVDAGKITTGILDASHLNVDDVIANVINGKTITGITINTPTLNLGDNGILTGTYSVADSTSYFQPINGTGKLDISHGYIQSTANLIYYNKIMRGMANSWGYWKDSVTFVPEAHLTIGNTAESTLTAGFLKLDIFDQAKTHVVSRSYLDGTGLYINSGGTEAVSSMLSDFELLSSGRAYLMGGVNVPKSEIITIGNLQINGNHTIASNDGRDVYFKKASPKGSAPVGIHAKSFTKYSQLSIKTDISDLPADEATRMLNSIDVEKYRYTSDGATYKYQYGAVIDDINELGNKQYSLPAELLSEDGTGINLDSMTGILIKTVQDQNKKIGELSMRLTRLETT